MFKRILVPTDGSKLSRKAVQAAIELARLFHARLVALHVRPRFSDSPHGIFGPDEDAIETAYNRQAKAQAEQLFADIRQRARVAGVRLEVALVADNDVWKAIISAARKKNCDVICMASHGRRGVSDVVLGSETHKVLTHSKIPVFVLR